MLEVEGKKHIFVYTKKIKQQFRVFAWEIKYVLMLLFFQEHIVLWKNVRAWGWGRGSEEERFKYKGRKLLWNNTTLNNKKKTRRNILIIIKCLSCTHQLSVKPRKFETFSYLHFIDGCLKMFLYISLLKLIKKFLLLACLLVC